MKGSRGRPRNKRGWTVFSGNIIIFQAGLIMLSNVPRGKSPIIFTVTLCLVIHEEVNTWMGKSLTGNEYDYSRVYFSWDCKNEHKTVRIPAFCIFFDQISILSACGTHAYAVYATSVYMCMCIEIPPGRLYIWGLPTT